MPFHRIHHLLLLLVALLFAVGHLDLVLGSYDSHHHDAEVTGHHDENAGGQHEGSGEEDADHMLQHDGVVGVMPAITPKIIAPCSITLMDISILTMPEAPVAGIDYPPQLVG